MGSYVFLWGQKQERTPTWYGMFLEDGTETETIDVMHYIWTGAWPENRTPQSTICCSIRKLRTGRLSRRGQPLRGKVVASDPDGDALRYRWEMMHESEATQEGGDPRKYPRFCPV